MEPKLDRVSRRPVVESEAVPRLEPWASRTGAGKAAGQARVPAQELLRAVLVLRSRPLAPGHPLRHRTAASLRPHQRRRLSRSDLVKLQSAHPDAVAAVQAFARRAGLRVVESSRVRHDVVLEGTAAAFEAAFHVELEHFATRRGRRRGHRGPAHLPAPLEDVIESVLGLDELPLARRALPARAPRGELFWPRQVAEAYRFPRGRGRGQTIAILCFGGGFHAADLEAYFAMSVRGTRPRVRVASVLGARNAPLEAATLRRFVLDFQARLDAATLAKRYGPDLETALDTLETTMDLEIAGALCPDAELQAWFAPDTPAGWYAAIHAALGEAGALDPRARRRPRPPTVISISWGNVESQWNANRMWAIHRALELCRHHATTVCCASGDFGSLGAPPGEAALPGVSFPASSPYALACGGTRLRLRGDRAAEETAWNSEWGGARMASGGGLSGLFPRPDWQRRAGVPEARDLASPVWTSRQVERPSRFRGRGVPDVAANADGDSGYRIRVGGVDTVGGGTSAATPLWAALVALLAEELGHPLGWLNPLAYRADLAPGFRDVTRGTNDVSPRPLGFFRAGPGWDAVSGLGSPDGQALLGALRPRR
jgi:kumamolisin